MSETHARLKALVSRHVRGGERKWRAAYGRDVPPPDWPRRVYRVLCGQVFAATGNWSLRSLRSLEAEAAGWERALAG